MATLREEARDAPYYVPRKLASAWASVAGPIGNGTQEALAVTKADARQRGREAVIMFYKGNPPRQSFAGYAMVMCDVGAVGDKFGEIAVTLATVDASGGLLRYGPMRFGLKSRRVYLIKEA